MNYLKKANVNVKSKLVKICRAVMILFFVNWGIFALIAIIIGGDAINGYSELGHYYLRYKAQFTEVSYSVFIYSKVHAYSLFVTLPFAFVSQLILLVTGELKRGKGYRIM